MIRLVHRISSARRSSKAVKTRCLSSTGTSAATDTRARWRILSRKGPLFSVGVFGGVISGGVGAYLWRFRWCENQLQSFAVNDMDGGESPCIDARLQAYQHSRCTPQAEKDAEALRQILNTPPKGITFVEASTDRLAEHFVYTALAPRPCVMYLSLDKCMIENPDMLIRYVAEKFGAYVVFSFYALREKFFLGPPPDTVLLRSLRSVLDIIRGSLSRLKSEHAYNYFPPVVVITGTDHYTSGDDISGEATRAGRLIAKYFLSFCHDMSLKGLLHVVIPQRSGTTMLTSSNFSTESALRGLDQIFILRPMNVQESLIYLYSNIFTTYSVIPGDLLRRMKITEKGEKLRLKQVQLWDDFRAQNPSQVAILTVVAELIHSNDDMLDKYIELVISQAVASAKTRISSINQTVISSDLPSHQKIEPVRLEVTEIMTPRILYSAYRLLLREQYRDVASTVLSTFLCGDDQQHGSLVSYERKDAASKNNSSALREKSAHPLEVDRAPPALVEDDLRPGAGEGEGGCHSSYQPSVAQSAGVSPEDYYDHLFDRELDPSEPLLKLEKKSSESTDIIAPYIGGESPKIETSSDDTNSDDTLQRIYDVARKRLHSKHDPSDAPTLSAIDFENENVLGKKDREAALKSVSNAIVALTQAPQVNSKSGILNSANNSVRKEENIAVWRFVHDYLRGKWGSLWYLVENKIVTLGLPQHTADDEASDNRDAVLISQSTAVHQYVVQFSSPLQRRIAETFIIDGGCDVKDDLTAALSRAAIPQPLKYKKHRPLANKRSSINVVGYGAGDVEQMDESFVENDSEPNIDSYGLREHFGSMKHTLRKSGVSRNFDYLTPVLGSCDIDRSDVIPNILYGSALKNCNLKLDALFDDKSLGTASGIMHALSESQRCLVRACAVRMNLCAGSYPSSSAKLSDSDLTGHGNLRSSSDGVTKGSVFGLINTNALLAAYHLEQIARSHGAIDVHTIQETLAIQGYLHNRHRIELALDMLYLEAKAVVPIDLVLLLDRLELEEMVRSKE